MHSFWDTTQEFEMRNKLIHLVLLKVSQDRAPYHLLSWFRQQWIFASLFPAQLQRSGNWKANARLPIHLSFLQILFPSLNLNFFKLFFSILLWIKSFKSFARLKHNGPSKFSSYLMKNVHILYMFYKPFTYFPYKSLFLTSYLLPTNFFHKKLSSKAENDVNTV